MTDAFNNMFGEFARAAKALDRLPELEADLASTQGTLGVEIERNDKLRTLNIELQCALATVEKELAAKEAELAQATFREDAARSKLEMLVGAFKTVVGEAQAAVELVSPTPEPEAIPHGAGAGAWSGEVATSEENPTLPTTDGSLSPEQNSLSTSTDTPVGYEAHHDTFVYSTEATRNSNGPFASPQNSQLSGGIVDCADAQNSRGVASPNGPFVSSADVQSQPAPDTTNTSQVTEAGSEPIAEKVIVSPPKPYWQKPDGMPWQAWIALGNEYPNWVHPDGTQDEFH